MTEKNDERIKRGKKKIEEKCIRSRKRRKKAHTLLLILFNTSSRYVSMRKRLPAQDRKKKGFYVRPKFIYVRV